MILSVALPEYPTSSTPLLLHVEPAAVHGGRARRAGAVPEITDTG